MDPILTAVLLVAGIGLISGTAIAILSKFMAIPVDEKAAAIEEILPQANCGSCGFSGCSGYAAALSSGKTSNTGLCNPGGQDVANKVASIMGLAASAVMPMTAVVRCRGGKNVAQTKYTYSGVPSCSLASQLFGGEKACRYGCIGFGDCVAVCPYNAIAVCGGVAKVNNVECRACGKCVTACPKKLIELVPADRVHAAVLCRNADKGAVTHKLCSAGCIGCMKCQKVCESGAVTVTDNRAYVDFSKCIGCGKCVEACPTKAINLLAAREAAK